MECQTKNTNMREVGSKSSADSNMLNSKSVVFVCVRVLYMNDTKHADHNLSQQFELEMLRIAKKTVALRVV